MRPDSCSWIECDWLMGMRLACGSTVRMHACAQGVMDRVKIYGMR